MTKALFFDIDGTLVSFETHRIPQSTIEALEAAKRNGVKVFISTGRPRQLINNIGAVEHLVDGYVMATGACCTLGSQTVSLSTIPDSEAREMVRLSNDMHFGCLVVGTRDLALINPTDDMRHVVFDVLNVGYSAWDVPLQEVLSQGILQFTPFFTPEQEHTVLASMPHCISTRWHPAFSDVTMATADKGRGLVAITGALGIQPGDTMAFGDGGNDVSIMHAAGIGVAMGNATDEVKSHADYVTADVDHDGISRALRHFGVIG